MLGTPIERAPASLRLREPCGTSDRGPLDANHVFRLQALGALFDLKFHLRSLVK
jgi:hypothetical protein